jgi:pimeloyl-ACP methyl ester carboxylesterase
MEKTILVVGGHSWWTGSPQPLLAQVEAVIKTLGLEGYDIKGVPYRGFSEWGTMGHMVTTICRAIDNTPGKVYLIGNSAGGQLAMCAARLRPSKVAGVISVCGALDFGQIPSMSVLVRKLGKGLDPVKWAGELRVPLLLIHGSKDTMVKPNATTNFFNAARWVKDKQIVFVPDKGHDVSCLAEAGASVKRFLEGVAAD